MCKIVADAQQAAEADHLDFLHAVGCCEPDNCPFCAWEEQEGQSYPWAHKPELPDV